MKNKKGEKVTTNPNGSNQYLMDPRQQLCWDYYINPKSETFSNAMRSAIKAGYEEGTAGQITVQNWFIDKLRRLQMLSKAEKVLDYTLEMNTENHIKIGDEVIIKQDPALVKIKQDTAKFITERLGKDNGYSTRVENTGKDGQELKIVFDNSFNK